MPKKKKKSIRKIKTKAKSKTKKKVARPINRARGKASPRKKKTARNRNRNSRVLAVEVSAVEVIQSGEDEYDFGQNKASEKHELDEHFPPDYGGSE